MRDCFSNSTLTAAIAAAAVSAAISVVATRASAQAPALSGTALKTPWGEPDLQGIWTDEFDTPLQRPAKYATQEFFTEAQREELDRQRARALRRRPAPGARDRGRCRRRLQHGVSDHQARRPAHIDDRRSARWPDAAADAAGPARRRRRSGVSPRAAAIDRDLQEQGSRSAPAANTIRRPRRDLRN